MMRSTHRILTTHAGGLPRPDDLRALVTAKAGGQPYAEDALARRVRSAVAEVVRKQVESGIDSVNESTTASSASPASRPTSGIFPRFLGVSKIETGETTSKRRRRRPLPRLRWRREVRSERSDSVRKDMREGRPGRIMVHQGS